MIHLRQKHGASVVNVFVLSLRNVDHASNRYPNWAFQRGGPWLKELSAEDNHQLWDWSARLQDQLDAGGKVVLLELLAARV